jgi:hypothetical protein
MAAADWPTSPSDEDLEELDQFLRGRSGDDDLLLDGVHGLLTASRSSARSMPTTARPRSRHAAGARVFRAASTCVRRSGKAVSARIRS